MYGLSDEDLDIQTRARVFADELIPFEVEAELSDGLPADVTEAHKKRAMQLGLHSANMPKELGGGGYTSLQQVLVQEQVGRVTNALGWVAATPPSWLPPVATPDQIERYLKPAARRDGDEWVLNGVKWHVTSYNTADYCFFQAKTAGGEHLMFLVDLPAPGVSVLRTPAYSHTISHHHPIVGFAGVRVPAASLVGGEGDGMSYAREWFRFERLMVAARCLGAAERLVAEMTEFAKTREAGGRPIAEHGLVAGMLADSMTELFAARSMLYETARGIDRGADVKVAHGQCSMAKLYCSEMANRVADRAVQVFGGRGYMRENVAERFFRELRVERIWEGTSEIQRMIIAGQMTRRGPATLA
jgi:acyl-CoA dehydrogenase